MQLVGRHLQLCSQALSIFFPPYENPGTLRIPNLIFRNIRIDQSKKSYKIGSSAEKEGVRAAFLPNLSFSDHLHCDEYIHSPHSSRVRVTCNTCIAWQKITVSIRATLLQNLWSPLFFLSRYFGSRDNCVSDEHFSRGARSKGHGLVYSSTKYKPNKEDFYCDVDKEVRTNSDHF